MKPPSAFRIYAAHAKSILYGFKKRPALKNQNAGAHTIRIAVLSVFLTEAVLLISLLKLEPAKIEARTGTASFRGRTEIIFPLLKF